MNGVLLPLHRELRASSRAAAWTAPETACGGPSWASWSEQEPRRRSPSAAWISACGCRHAILRAVFPMALGLSLAPRRLGGVVMGASAAATAMLLHAAGGAGLGIGALTSLCLIGPMLDAALWRAKSGWPVYLSFAAGGRPGEHGGFAVRGARKLSGWESLLKRPLADWFSVASWSYLLCGLLAGLLSAAIWFRWRAGHGEERTRESAVVIHVGIDDTDMPDTPGTNQLARALVQRVADACQCVRITRHQLLDDPRVPCTSHNGSASILFQPLAPLDREQLVGRLRQRMQQWFVPGSDPGLCVAETVPADVTEFALRCQRELVTQETARSLAEPAGFTWRDSAGPKAA